MYTVLSRILLIVALISLFWIDAAKAETFCFARHESVKLLAGAEKII